MPGLQAGERLLITAIAAGGSPKQLGATAAAISRVGSHASPEEPVAEKTEQAIADEVALRQWSIQPFLMQKVAAGATGQTACISGHVRATRNVAEHHQLGHGALALADALAQPKRAQRGQRRRPKFAGSDDAAGHALSVSEVGAMLEDVPVQRAERLEVSDEEVTVPELSEHGESEEASKSCWGKASCWCRLGKLGVGAFVLASLLCGPWSTRGELRGVAFVRPLCCEAKAYEGAAVAMVIVGEAADETVAAQVVEDQYDDVEDGFAILLDELDLTAEQCGGHEGEDIGEHIAIEEG